MQLLFLSQLFDVKAESNLALLTEAAISEGHRVSWGSIDHLRLNHQRVQTQGFYEVASSQNFERSGSAATLDCLSFDCVWVLSLGERASFLDKLQLLRIVEGQTRVINSTEALLHLRSKYALTQLSHLFQHPKTYGSRDPETLFKVIEAGGDWILKPPAGSLGQGVFLINRETSNYRDILRHVNGIKRDQYVLLQAYIPEIKNGEKRVLLANGKLIGTYLRTQTDDHRTNLMQGATAQATVLSEEEVALINRLGEHCKTLGACFVGIDLVYPFVIEINVVNPGGLNTLDQLGDGKKAHLVIRHILSS